MLTFIHNFTKRRFSSNVHLEATAPLSLLAGLGGGRRADEVDDQVVVVDEERASTHSYNWEFEGHCGFMVGRFVVVDSV